MSENEVKHNPISLEECRNEVAKKYGYENWYTVDYYRIDSMEGNDGPPYAEDRLWTEAAELYASQYKEENVRLINVLKGYEQWEADILSEDKLWWPNRALDVFRGPLYTRMMELQEMRNEALRGTKTKPGQQPF